MSGPRKSLLLGACASLLMLAGCGRGKAPDAPAPQVVSAPHLTYNANAGEGEKLFERNCIGCHAAKISPVYPGTYALAKTRGDQFAIITRRKDLNAQTVSAVVRNGIGFMPAFGPTEIDDRQLAALAAYVVEPRP
nr:MULTISPECIES: c-type cytochrome [unclassified Pseudomonas]